MYRPPTLPDPDGSVRYVPEGSTEGWAAAGPGQCSVVEQSFDGDRLHGVHAIAEYGQALTDAYEHLPVLTGHHQGRCGAEPGAAVARQAAEWSEPLAWDEDGQAAMASSEPASRDGRLVFFDIETTGLSGGAGTYAFLVGLGFFEQGGFHTRQFLMTGYEAERELLASFRGALADAGAIVTFNGRTFDVPVMETRYLFHRVASPFDDLDHVDMLHPARRLWGRRSGVGDWETGGQEEGPSRHIAPGCGEAGRRTGGTADWPSRPRSDGCSLGALERAILGFAREGDVPGFEIPSRYFHYLRTGDPAPLVPVLEHNRLDLVSLAAITAVAARLVAGGAAAAGSPQEALALARLFERAGREGQAVSCAQRAAGVVQAPWDPTLVEAWVRTEALRMLAVRSRRQRRFDEAAALWQQLIAVPNAPPALRHEAIEALAIHHEHRSRDLQAARAYALEALRAPNTDAAREGVRYRLARLDRKLGPAAAAPFDPLRRAVRRVGPRSR